MPARRSSVPLLVLVVVLLAVAGSTAVLGSAGPAVAAPEDPPSDAGIQVDGVGRASAAPDVVRFPVGVESSAATVGEALAGTDAAALRLLETLRELGVADSDVQTVNVSLYPRFDRDGQEITGYSARHDLTVTVRELDRAGAVMGAAVEAGGDAARLQGLSLALEDDAAVQAKAREKAFDAARAKAEQYAELTGATLGDVVWVREQVSTAGPAAGFATDAAAAEAVPIAAGSAEVVVTVAVRWSLT